MRCTSPYQAQRQPCHGCSFGEASVVYQIHRKRLLNETATKTRMKQIAAIDDQKLLIQKRLQNERKLLNRQAASKKVRTALEAAYNVQQLLTETAECLL